MSLLALERGLTAGHKATVMSSDECALVIVQPALEPWPKTIVKMLGLAAFIYCRWDTWGVGFTILRGGLAIYVGPLMFGMVNIDRQLGLALRAHILGEKQ